MIEVPGEDVPEGHVTTVRRDGSAADVGRDGVAVRRKVAQQGRAWEQRTGGQVDPSTVGHGVLQRGSEVEELLLGRSARRHRGDGAVGQDPPGTIERLGRRERNLGPSR
ncbi:MAG: hypothetical protein V9G12_08795 [Microthrixaceae bacterium]